ncbi:MAG TPA: hypothetical protein VKZ51_05765 [Cyclobacteriaceae bacterium]|nr:hypothetical protein [Cyclobacteriaceae bacterium]
MNLSEKKKEIIERVGVYYEHKGLQPVVGRIVGLLLVAEPAEATFEEIYGELQVSKSAVSTALTFMQAKEMVEYTTKPGDRKRYFKLRLNEWKTNIQKQFDDILDIENLIKEVVVLKENRQSDFCCKLIDIKNFLLFLRKELPLLLDKFEATKNK